MGRNKRPRKYLSESQMTGRPTKFNPSVVADIYATGVSAAEVARLLGMHHASVLYTLNSMGIETNGRARGACPLGSLDRRISAIAASITAVGDRLEGLFSEMESATSQRDEILSSRELAAAKTEEILGTARIELVNPDNDWTMEKAMAAKKRVADKEAEREAQKSAALEARRAELAARIERMMKIAAPKRSRFAA